jgi:hypothetical protein
MGRIGIPASRVLFGLNFFLALPPFITTSMSAGLARFIDARPSGNIFDKSALFRPARDQNTQQSGSPARFPSWM